MHNFKKGSIIGISALIGVLAVGGTVFAFNQHQHEVLLDQAKKEIKSEQASLQSIHSQLSKLEDKNGFLSSEVTLKTLNELEKSLNSMKDSHVDFNIKKDMLKNEIEVVKIGKEEVTSKLNEIRGKFKLQEEVNSLFIEGDLVLGGPIVTGLTAEKTSGVLDVLTNYTSKDSKWYKTMQELVNDAISQVNHTDMAVKVVETLLKDGKVVEGASRKQYASALKEVGLLKNEEIKDGLVGKLDIVLNTIEANEKEAERVAQIEKERIVKQQEEQRLKQEKTKKQQTNASNNETNASKSSSIDKESSKPAVEKKPDDGEGSKTEESKTKEVNGVKTGEGCIYSPIQDDCTMDWYWESFEFEGDLPAPGETLIIKIN